MSKHKSENHLAEQDDGSHGYEFSHNVRLRGDSMYQSGLALRDLFKGQWRTRNPLALIVMTIIGILLFALPISAVLSLERNLAILFLVLFGSFGVAMLVNVVLSLRAWKEHTKHSHKHDR